MQKALIIIFACLCSELCKGQSKAIDTLKVRAIISSIDSTENVNAKARRYIVRKYIHNETTVNYEFLMDTSTGQIYKCDFVSRTLQTLRDTILERTSFYVYDSQLVALKYQELRNSRSLTSKIIYLESENGKVQDTYPVKSSELKPLTLDDIEYRATELWLGGGAFKEMLTKSKGG